jgi:hypothetical protein
MTKLTDLPTKQELEVIFRIRTVIKEKEPILFRELRDTQSDTKGSQCLDYFQSLSCAAYGLSKFKSMMYYLFVTAKLGQNGKTEFIKSMSDFLLSRYYIRDHREIQEGLACNIKFDDVDEAIRWIMAYRITKSHMQKKVSAYNKITDKSI